MKELLQKILKYYEDHLQIIKSSDFNEDLYEYLFRVNLNHGVCKVSKMVYGVYLYNDTFIAIHKRDYSNYWYETPAQVNYDDGTDEEMIKTLEFRVNKLKSII